jgi:hypothetical protein
MLAGITIRVPSPLCIPQQASDLPLSEQFQNLTTMRARQKHEVRAFISVVKILIDRMN